MIKYDMDAIDYIAKIADGGMRDAITLMDKCLAYSNYLTLENVIKALGVIDYDVMFNITDAIADRQPKVIIKLIDSIYKQGKDLKLFIRNYAEFILDLCKYNLTKSYEFIKIPSLYNEYLTRYGNYEFQVCNRLLSTLVKLNADIKWETNPKALIEATLMLEVADEQD